MSRTIEVKILNILWPRIGTENPRNWYRLECKAEHGVVICVGSVKWRPSENELMVLTGEFEAWKGQRNFKFSEARPFIPANPRAQLSYVVERTKGMGPAAEAAIWERFGDGWRKMDAKGAEELKIRADAYENFRQQVDALDRDAEKCNTISYLLSRQCSNAIACAAQIALCVLVHPFGNRVFDGRLSLGSLPATGVIGRIAARKMASLHKNN